MHTTIMDTKFQSNIFIFGGAMAKKQVNMMTYLFETFFAFLIIVPENDIFEIMRQNWTR